jgi:cytoplasmic iron level regulating protein YaaA (DUF328/UPF0246 family)
MSRPGHQGLRVGYPSIMPALIAILSPAKTLDMDAVPDGLDTTRPRLQGQTRSLAETLQPYTPAKLSKLMSISDKLATLNAQRWSDFGDRANPRGPAAMCFRGDVYQGLEAWTLDGRSLAWAQKHVRILSGLFGLLRPLDVIQPYRLEMGTKLKTDAGSNLYQFWGNAITKTLRKDMADAKAGTLVNLASDEYSKAIDFDGLGVDVLETTFLQRTGGKDKFISFHAKRARGLMARWMAEHRPKSVKDLRGFNLEGYRCDAKASDDVRLVFTRPKPAAKKAG